MQKFIEHLKKGEFRMPTCTLCGASVWPPSHRCSHCLSKTSMKKIDMTGILLEFTSSHIKGKEGVFGVVQMSGIKLVGSFSTTHLKEGMKVKMKKCGIGTDGTAFYFFMPAKA